MSSITPDAPVRAAAAALRTWQRCDALWASTTHLPTPDVERRWCAGPSSDTVCPECVVETRDVEVASSLLSEAAATLAGQHWDVDAPRDGTPRVLARTADQSLTLSARDGALRLTLRGAPLAVDDTTRRGLLSRARRPGEGSVGSAA